MKDEPGLSSRSATQWLSTVKAFEREGEFFKAFDLAAQGLSAYRDDVPLKHRAVLCLARAGATDLAQRKYDEFGLSSAASDSEDVDALGARLLKDEALAATGEKRRLKAAEAADRYASIHERFHNYYPAINAATLRLVAGDEATARTYARIALAELDGGDEDYYSYATRIEALIVLDDIEGARALFPKALKANHGDQAALATTWRQLQLVLQLKNLDPKVIAPAFAPMKVVHFLGHIIKPGGRFKAVDESQVRQRVAEYFDEQRVGAGFGSLAAGSDIIIAEELLRHGASLHVVLPFEMEEFIDISVRPSGKEWVRRFEACLAAAATVRWATEDSYLGDDYLFAYCSKIAMGLAVLRGRHLGSEVEQLAVWDGRPAAGTGGTADDVEHWRRTGFAQTIIKCGNFRGGAKPAARPAIAKPAGGRLIRAMLFCDFKGFSKLTDAELPSFVTNLLGAVGKVIASYGGAVDFANTWGDGLFLVFEDPAQAARCALDLQRALSRLDLAEAGLPASMRMRIGGHLGPTYAAHDPVLNRTNYFGAHVSRAARIEPVTPEGCVYVTETFAAVLGLEHSKEFSCDYVGMTESAKKYGSMRMFLLRRLAGNV
ncbi:MAG TPA: adenylate/guanylate cyclase domain-containing protein [Stellaceae bacterium]|nr:adenylate/guanylate cyclase domain-containing protein [Stellaceae bacterium]